MTGAVTLAAAAVGSLALGGYEASQANSNASTQLGMESTVFGEQQGYAAQLAALMKNPSSVTSLPGYSFNFGQGADAVSREMAAGGFAGSGNEATALTQYGQGFAMNTFNQQAQLLAQLSGITAPSSPTQYGATGTGAQGQSFNQLSSVLASLGYLTGGNSNLPGGGGSGITTQDLAVLGQGNPSTMAGPGGYTYNTPGSGWGS